MPNLERSPYAASRSSSERTDRFKTRDLIDPEAKFNSFLKEQIQDFVGSYPPLKEPFNYGAELRQNSVDIKRPLNQRTISSEKIKMLNEVRTKSATQLMAEGRVKYLIERSIVEGYNQPENLEKIIREFSRLYGFNLETQESFKQMLKIYYTNKDRVNDFFEERQNNPEKVFFDLFRVRLDSFGLDEKGQPKVKVYQGPAGVEIFCDNETLKKIVAKIYYASDEIKGFSGTEMVKVGPLIFPIFYNFNTSNDPEVYFHELGHNWNKMFKYLNQVQLQADEDQFLDKTFYKISQQQNIEKDLFEFLVNSINPQLQRFGDELLAKLKSQTTLDDFFDFDDLENPYDYLRDFRNSTTNSVDIYDDEFYCRQIGSLSFLRQDTPFNKNPNDKTIEHFEFQREQMIRLKKRVFEEYYLRLTQEIVKKVSDLLLKKPQIRTNLIGLLGNYPDVEVWPTLIDKLLSDL